jgi:hypothetical protein
VSTSAVAFDIVEDAIPKVKNITILFIIYLQKQIVFLLVIQETIRQVNVDGENSPRRQDTHHGGHVILWDPFNII